MAACGTGAPGTALSHAGVELQLSRLARCSLVSMSSCFFSLWKTGGRGNGKKGAHPLPCSSPCYNDERVNRKGTIELVTTVCMGFAEFPVHKLQSWSEIHVVGEYHELHVCPVYVKAVVYRGTIALIEAISPIR